METFAELFWCNSKRSSNSTSGGAFSTIADLFFEKYKNGKVYGCYWDENAQQARHIPITNRNDIYKIQGSKYVQSNVENIFQKVKDDLQNNIPVLFSGTSCQVAALKSFLGEKWNEDILFLVDIICHGVPSPRLLKLCIDYYEKKYDGKMKNLKFRNKSKYNRNGYIMSFVINDKKYQINAEDDGYYASFLKGLSLRPSCYECRFINKNREGDISLGDSNNYKFHPEDAISLVIVNTEKGNQLYSAIKFGDKLGIKVEDEALTNKQLKEPCVRPQERDFFYVNVYNNGYESIIPQRSIMKRAYKNITSKIPTKYKIKAKKLLRKL